MYTSGKTPAELLESANMAYAVLTNLGPFYGNDQEARPTFRVAAEPLTLPYEYKQEFYRIGEAILELGDAIESNYNFFAGKLHPTTPISWRIDSIIDETDTLKVNEINIPDGADALMTAEQKAYSLDPPYGISTPSAYVRYFDSLNDKKEVHRIAIIAESVGLSPYTANVERMAELIELESDGRYLVTVIDRFNTPQISDWSEFFLVLNNGGYISPSLLAQYGLANEKIISAGGYSALGSKAIFAAIHNENDPMLPNLPRDTREYLKTVIPYTELVEGYDSTVAALNSKEWVVKAYYAPDQQIKRLERGRSVVGPWNSTEDRLKMVKLLNLGVKFVKQVYVQPKKYDVHLRARGGKGLDFESRFNRICVKYVNIPYENKYPVPTAVEATLGTKVVPTGRDTCFLPVLFAESSLR